MSTGNLWEREGEVVWGFPAEMKRFQRYLNHLEVTWSCEILKGKEPLVKNGQEGGWCVGRSQILPQKSDLPNENALKHTGEDCWGVCARVRNCIP